MKKTRIPAIGSSKKTTLITYSRFFFTSEWLSKEWISRENTKSKVIQNGIIKKIRNTNNL